ncbi:MAG: tRNA (guanosine(46)-N7)-methyltransferase TrmB [Chlamydiales bacterium]|nr:tRNA (guanosine(46)-N7)-methyltransferase TrmB [Chlamydiales bacterium]
MKPKDFKSPFRWDQRHPYMQDNVLFVPAYYKGHEAFEMPLLKGPIAVEYCSGNGEWIIQKCLDEPNYTWIAVEKKFQRVAKIWSKAQNNNLKNLLIVCGEAQTFTKHYLQDSSVEKIYVNYPDPWPKERHAKHRLIQTPFANEMARVAKEGAIATFVTDDQPYGNQMQSEMKAPWQLLRADLLDTSYGTSFFDQLWRSKGRSIQVMEFQCKFD